MRLVLPLVRRPVVRLPDRGLLTVDGVRLSARHEPHASDAGGDGRSLAFVVAHWFTGSWRRPDVQAERGFGHAETAATPDLVGRIARWGQAATGVADGSARMRR
jgi:hypothetical protein